MVVAVWAPGQVVSRAVMGLTLSLMVSSILGGRGFFWAHSPNSLRSASSKPACRSNFCYSRSWFGSWSRGFAAEGLEGWLVLPVAI